MPDLELLLDRPGGQALRLTPVHETLRFTTAAVGGFGDCSFQIAGDPGHWKREIPKLSALRLVLGTQVVWEGRVEDTVYRLVGGQMGLEVGCFGFQRLLDDVSVRRIWSQRDFEWRAGTTRIKEFDVTTGSYDDTDLTKIGIQFTGNGTSFASGQVRRMNARAPVGLTWTRVMADYAESGGNTTNFNSRVEDSTNGSTLNTLADPAGTSIDLALTNGARIIYLALRATSSWTTVSTDIAEYRNIRLLGTSLTEDAPGGFHGGTILQDLIALVPGLTPGIIETGSDFTIEAIERAVRGYARGIVDEVAGYYTRYWAVWEDQTFEWREHHLDEPHWIATIPQLADGSELRSTADGVTKTVYVQYTDVDGTEREKTAESTDQRNPWVKQGKTRDEIIDLGGLHPGARGPKRLNRIRKRTANLAQQRANLLATDLGRYPAIEGQLVLPINEQISHAQGGKQPAYTIRAGESIVIPDLPKSDILSTGRDGETLFHIVATEVDFERGTVTLEVEGQTSRTDVILARLAAATRPF